VIVAPVTGRVSTADSLGPIAATPAVTFSR
jgi:hypothetical protein